jgi:hypothetical protein
VNDSRSRAFGASRNVAGSRCVYGVGDLRSCFRSVYSRVSGGVYNDLWPMSLDCRPDLATDSYVTVAVTEPDNLKTRRRRLEKLDAELPTGSHDKRAHYSLRI